MAQSVIELLQKDLADRLLADPFFVNIPIIYEILGDIENQIDIAVKKIGIVVIIVTPTADVRQSKDAPGPYFDAINIVVRICENVIVNRAAHGTGKSSLLVAEYVLASLHHYAPANIVESVFATSPTISLVPDPYGLLTYDLQFQTQGGIKYDIPIVADPVITRNGGNIEIACATPHANIFYSTTAGAVPSPRSGTFYAGPFAAAGGTTVKSKAWLAGYVNSALVKATV